MKSRLAEFQKFGLPFFLTALCCLRSLISVLPECDFQLNSDSHKSVLIDIVELVRLKGEFSQKKTESPKRP